MNILSARLLAIEITKPVKYMNVASGEDWAVEPTFVLGENLKNEIIQNVDILIIRTKVKRQATITVRTTWKIQLGSSEVKPTTEQDFQVYTEFAQLATAHARALFQREVRGTVFENDILPFDFYVHAIAKVKLAISLHDSQS